MLLRSRILVFQLIFAGHAVNVAVDLRGEFAGSETLYREALAMYRTLHGERDLWTYY